MLELPVLLASLEFESATMLKGLTRIDFLLCWRIDDLNISKSIGDRQW